MLPVFAVQEAHASAAGRLYAWGRNDDGQFGNGLDIWETLPARMPDPPGGVADWNQLDMIQRSHQTLAITPDGHLYVWGRNNFGQLGLGDTNNRYSPVRNNNLPSGVANWNEVEFLPTGWAFSLVRTQDGRLYGWGMNEPGYAASEGGYLGLGHTNPVLAPTEIPLTIPGAANWNDIEFVELNHNLGGRFTFVKNPEGRLFGWGINEQGQMGLGHNNPVISPTEIPLSPLFGVSSWSDVELIKGYQNSFVRTSDGRLFAWGNNGQGRLGMGHNTNNVFSPTEMPNNLPGMSNWNDVRILTGNVHTTAITPDGRLFTWGRNDFGQLGQGDITNRNVPTENTNLPPGVTNWNDVEIIIGSQHSFAITPDGRLFTWGRNIDGALGLGDTTNRNVPTENTNLPQGARDWHDMEIFTGGHDHTFARVRPLDPIPITKTLRLNEGTIVPGTEMPVNTPAGKVSDEATFTFRFVQRPAIRISDDPIRYSHANVPAIANQTITIDPSTATTPVNGVFTATGNTVCIRALVYAQNPFPSGGVFVWEVYEVPNSSGLHDYPCVQVVYDTSRYQIRAHSNSAGIIEIIEIFEMERDAQNMWQIVLPKLGSAPFTNTYTRLVGDEGLPLHNALLISKQVEGQMADLSTQFNFTLTLTNPALTPPVVGDGTTGPVIAQVVQSGTNPPVAVSPARTVAIAPGDNNFFLMHNESLLIPQLPAGTSFTVTEAAHLQFEPAATVTALTSGTYPRQEPNTDLETGTYIIHQVNNNIAAFTNHHRHIDPTGLFITSTPWVALGAAALLVGLLATSRNRRKIEELPLVF